VETSCLFCGGPADTEEDFLPRWYQRKLSPDNNRIFLPNDTAMPHRSAKVPACEADNVLFSKLENKISSGTFTEDEAYLWAFKIHAGFCSLRLRQRAILSNPDSGLISVAGPMQIWPLKGLELWVSLNLSISLFRRLVRVWKDAPGSFRPSPLGSVFDLPSAEPGYRFMHAPCGYVAFNLGSRFLAVSLFDGGFAKTETYDDNWTQGTGAWKIGRLLPPLKSEFPVLFEKFWLCSVAYCTMWIGWPIRLCFSKRDVVAARCGPEAQRFLPDEDSFLLLGKQFGIHSRRRGGKLEVTLKPREFISPPLR
jgi:hypothetical protein